MKKYPPAFALLLIILSLHTNAQNIVAGRMNEVFLKSNLSTNSLNTP